MNRFFTPTPLKLSDLCARLGCPVPAGKDSLLEGLLPLEDAGPTHLAYFGGGGAYTIQAQRTKAGAVILKKEDAPRLPAGVHLLTVPHPYAAFAMALQAFYPALPVQFREFRELSDCDAAGGNGSSQNLNIHPTAQIETGATLHPTAVIGAHVHIGKGCVIGPHCVIQCADIGENVVLHPGVCIGQDGFGFIPTGKSILKIPQVGCVVIENGVEIGAGTTIDRACLGVTRIGAGCKIDNQVQIAHNVILGKNCQISGQVGMAGSAVLGNGVIVGGQTGIGGHLFIADHVQIAARSGVIKSLKTKGEIVGGFPAVPIGEWRRQRAIVRQAGKKRSI